MTPHHTLAPTTDRTVPGAAPPPTREVPPHGPTLQQHVGHGLRPWLMLLAQFGRFARWASRFMARASHGFPASAHAVRKRSYTLGLPPLSATTPARRSSPRSPSSTIRLFSLAANRRRVVPRIS